VFNISLFPTSRLKHVLWLLNKATAMEKAKAGALVYINQMVKEVERGIETGLYRNDHYGDLNINLLNADINRIKRRMNMT